MKNQCYGCRFSLSHCCLLSKLINLTSHNIPAHQKIFFRRTAFSYSSNFISTINACICEEKGICLLYLCGSGCRFLNETKPLRPFANYSNSSILHELNMVVTENRLNFSRLSVYYMIPSYKFSAVQCLQIVVQEQRLLNFGKDIIWYARVLRSDVNFRVTHITQRRIAPVT